MTVIARPAPCAAARPTALPAYTRWVLALVTAVAAGLLVAPGLRTPTMGEPVPAVVSAPAPALLSSASAPAATLSSPRGTPVWVAPQPVPVAPSIQ